MLERWGRDRGATGGGAALVLAVLLLLAVGCALLAGTFYLRARQRVEALAGRVPFRETVVVRADTPTIVRNVQSLSRLETSRYTMEKILDAERTRRFVPSFLAGEKLVFVAHGEVVAGLDLSKLREEDVRVTGDSISLRLPEPEILYSRIDNEKSYVYDREEGILTKASKDLESQVRATAEQQLRESAVEDGILREARDNGRESLRALLRSMGFTEVEFR